MYTYNSDWINITFYIYELVLKIDWVCSTNVMSLSFWLISFSFWATIWINKLFVVSVSFLFSWSIRTNNEFVASVRVTALLKLFMFVEDGVGYKMNKKYIKLGVYFN